jgi:hypothetical protein
MRYVSASLMYISRTAKRGTLMSLEIHNIAPTQEKFSIVTGDPDAADAVALLQAYLALEYCCTEKILVPTAVYTPEKAYIYLLSFDIEWFRKIPV